MLNPYDPTPVYYESGVSGLSGESSFWKAVSFLGLESGDLVVAGSVVPYGLVGWLVSHSFPILWTVAKSSQAPPKQPWETIVCWHLQGNHQKPGFHFVVQEFVHPQN